MLLNYLIKAMPPTAILSKELKIAVLTIFLIVILWFLYKIGKTLASINETNENAVPVDNGYTISSSLQYPEFNNN